MDKFTIGGKEYDAVVTYRVRRFFSEHSKKELIDKMSFEDLEDVVLDAILMCFVDKTLFSPKAINAEATKEEIQSMRRELLMDALTNDEYRALDKMFGKILNPDVEGKTDAEKKPE